MSPADLLMPSCASQGSVVYTLGKWLRCSPALESELGITGGRHGVPPPNGTEAWALDLGVSPEAPCSLSYGALFAA